MRNARRGAALLVCPLRSSRRWRRTSFRRSWHREAEGEAAIVGGNVDRAAREAKEAALRSAVEQVAGVLVSSQSLAVNSQLVSDQVYAHSAGYVRSYEVLSQTTERNVVKVKVRAQVGTAELDRDLQAVQALVQPAPGPEAGHPDPGADHRREGRDQHLGRDGDGADRRLQARRLDGHRPLVRRGEGAGVLGGGAGGDRGQGDRHAEQGRLHPLRDGGLPGRASRTGSWCSPASALGVPAHRRLRPGRLRDLGRGAAGEGVREAPERDDERERQLPRGERLQPRERPTRARSSGAVRKAVLESLRASEQNGARHRGRGPERGRLRDAPGLPAAAERLERGSARGGLAVAGERHRQARGHLSRNRRAAGRADRRQVRGQARRSRSPASRAARSR